MEGPNNTTTPTLHTYKLLRRATFNHLYMVVYAAAILALLYHHTHTLLFTSSSTSLFSLLLLAADLILAFNWCCTQSFHLRPIRRHENLENLEKHLLKVKESESESEGELLFPAIDIFICTADPHKEPPIGTVNTAVSVMAYDYPPEKVSVYVSDDGGSQLTYFAFVEAAKFARHWLPFCRENHVVERCPQAYFTSCSNYHPSAEKIKTMYESMKERVENAVERGKIPEEHIDNENLRKVFFNWTHNYTRQDHPTVIEVLVASEKDKDVSGELMPNLIYVSREKSKAYHHHFKAGALNTLVRVSAIMTNAPMVLTLDCDTYSNDPQTIKRALCYFSDPVLQPTLAYVQFPQIFRNLNSSDIYANEYKRLYQIIPIGMDGLQGPCYVGTGCFFQRRAFFGSPTSLIQPEYSQLGPYHIVKKPIGSSEVLALAQRVATCDYENKTKWGSELGFRYGSMVEDLFTCYHMHCEGWKSILSHPKRAAFLGDSPDTLIDLLGQSKRRVMGHLDVIFSRYNTLTFGIKHMGLLMGLAYTHYATWPIHSIPYTIYAFVPQLALLNGISTFSKVSDPWFLLYIFLYVGVNGKDLLDYLLEKGTFKRWWNSQRMWMICSISSYLFGCIEFTLSSLGIMVHGFDVTSKQKDDELRKRYEQGIYEFGVASPMFVPLTMAAIINLVSFVMGLMRMFENGVTSMEGLILQNLLSGVGVINCWPVYQAIVLRKDKGRMPIKTTLVSTFLVSILCMVCRSFLTM